MILTKIADSTYKRVENEKQKISFEKVNDMAVSMPILDFPFEKSIKGGDIGFICEVKKASPSKGEIAKDFPYVEIAKEYEKAGASCISVLTEPCYFKGDIKFLKEISENVSVPLLRKDFTIDPYMIYDARIHGASCVLLICALLDDERLRQYMDICDSLGMSAIVETHDEDEVEMALRANARIIGVNNRDLNTFNVDLSTSLRLRKLVPKDVLFVAESGIKNASDVRLLKNAGADAVLIGETLMRAENKKAMLKELSEY